ncbi:hypothetical protein MHK_003706 [Candidatus Magnetomorum sp. HK-1]|nr:hypothetical protein MHK_003706 [Candidatus Magnetomorum sp. HK-1]
MFLYVKSNIFYMYNLLYKYTENSELCLQCRRFNIENSFLFPVPLNIDKQIF